MTREEAYELLKDCVREIQKRLIINMPNFQVQLVDKNGIKKINPLKGDKFDPHLHQAVMEQPSTEVEGGSVLFVMQAGYELFGRVIRPAMVAVAAKTAGAPTKNGYDSGAGEPTGEAVNTQAE